MVNQRVHPPPEETTEAIKKVAVEIDTWIEVVICGNVETRGALVDRGAAGVTRTIGLEVDQVVTRVSLIVGEVAFF